MVLTCTIIFNFNLVKAIVLLNMCPTEFEFIDGNFAHHYNFLLQPFKKI